MAHTIQGSSTEQLGLKAIPLIPPSEGAAFRGKDIHTVWRLAARNSMGQPKVGTEVWITTGVHCQKPL